jgi:Family of unknown function (DUF5330)
MKFLIRTVFWLGLVAILLPSGRSPQQGSAPPVAATEAVSAAAAAVSDLSGFCGRQPDACVTGSHAIAYFGQIAAAGAKVVYQLLTEALSKQAIPSPRANVKPPQNALTPADPAPLWRSAPPAREIAPDHPA